MTAVRLRKRPLRPLPARPKPVRTRGGGSKSSNGMLRYAAKRGKVCAECGVISAKESDAAANAIFGSVVVKSAAPPQIHTIPTRVGSAFRRCAAKTTAIGHVRALRNRLAQMFTDDHTFARRVNARKEGTNGREVKYHIGK